MRRIVALPLFFVLACSASPSDVAGVSGEVIGSPADPNPTIAFTQNALALGLDRTKEPPSASSCSFGTGVLQPYGSWFADFDGDGHLDVYNVNHGQVCHQSGLWLGNGTSGFGKNIYSVATTVAPTNGDYGLTNEVAFVGDLTGDGRPDLYFTSWSGLGGMCVNQGNAAHSDWSGPSFVCYTATMAAMGATSHPVLNFGDVNGDGKIDIETLDPTVTYNLYKTYCRTQPTVWLLNNGNPDPGTWTRVSNYQQFAGQSTGVFLDFNGDGRPDKIQGVEVASSQRGPYGGNSGGLRISLGQANGTYTQLTTTGLESVKPPITAIEDINEDGCLDVGVDQTGYRDNQTWYVQNKSGGACLLTFTAKARTALPYYPGFRRYTADFDNDGLLDHAVIVHIGYGNNDGVAGGIHIMRKLTNGTYQDLGAAGTNLNGTDSSEFYADNLAIGDWNEDGKVDIAGQGATIPGTDHGAGLWTSTLSTTNRWLKIQLPEVTGFFTGAATIEIYDAGFLGDATHYATPAKVLGTGNAWVSQIYDFGVGTRQTIDLRVTFPNGVRTTQIGVATNSKIVVHPLANVPPTASASANPPSAKVGHAIAFSGAGSTDSDGTIVSYAWTFGDGGSASGISASHAYASPGTFTATLTVTDNSGGTGSAQVTVNVVANLAPTPVASATPSAAVVGQPVSFSSSGSSDPDGLLTAFAWNFGDGASATGAAVGHTYAAPGSYVVTLTVTDDDGATATATVGVTVSDVVAPTMSIASVVVVVTANASDDVAVRSVSWTLDGAPQTGTAAPPFSFSFDFSALTPGTHTITGVATDTSGNQSQVSNLQIAR